MIKPIMQAEHIVHVRFGWPIGMKLRLWPAQHLSADYAHLGGCAVIVTGAASRQTRSGSSKQFVYLLEGRDDRFSTERVRPEDLELIPDADPIAHRINQAVVDALPDSWFRLLKSRVQSHPGN